VVCPTIDYTAILQYNMPILILEGIIAEKVLKVKLGETLGGSLPSNSNCGPIRGLSRPFGEVG
jgi:hypothetical protein